MGAVNDSKNFIYGDMSISMDEAIEAWGQTLEKVFPTRATTGTEEVKSGLYDTKRHLCLQAQSCPPACIYSGIPGNQLRVRQCKSI